MLINQKYYSAMDANGGGAPLITKSNYEYYFLLAVDGELSATEKDALQFFLSQNPDLQKELDSLQQTKLIASSVPAEKSGLYKNTAITITNYETYFLLAIDNELTIEEIEKLSVFLSENPALEKEFLLLQKTKLPVQDFPINKSLLQKTTDPVFGETTYSEIFSLCIDKETTTAQEEALGLVLKNDSALKKEFDLLQQTKLNPVAVVYPYKNSLYRKEAKRIPVMPIWIRYAAAACFILALSFLLGKNFFSKSSLPETKDITTITNPQNQQQNGNPESLPKTSGTNFNSQISGEATAIQTEPFNQSKLTVLKNTAAQKLNVNLPLNENNIVTNKNNNRIISNNDVANKKTVLNNTIVNKNPDETAIVTLSSGKANLTSQESEIAKISGTIKSDIPITASLTSTENETDNAISIMTIDAQELDKKGKGKNAKNKIGNFLKQKLNSIANTSIGVGRYEIALAK